MIDKFMTKYMKYFMNIYVYSILYVIYLYFFLDTLLIEPHHWFQSQWSGIFLICSAVFLSYTMIFQEKRIKLKYYLRKELTTFGIFFSLLLVFLFQYNRALTNWEVVLSQFLLMADIFMIAKIYSKYDKKNLFLFLSFAVPLAFVIYHTTRDAHVPPGCFENIKHLFENTQRVRYAFDFNHFNTLGNLIAGIIMISVIFIANTLKQKEWIVLKIAKIILPIVFYIPLCFILLCTASRTSILALGVFTLGCLYFVLTNLKFIPNLIKIIIKVILLVVLTIPSYKYINKHYDEIMDESNRRPNFEVNLPNMSDEQKDKYGIGLVYYGDFGEKIVEGYETSNIDNYYLYMYITTGKIGLTIFVIVYLVVLIKLWLNMYVNNSIEASVIVAAFIAHMVLGIGETCILYFTFLSGALLTAVYIITMDEFYNHISENKINIKNIFKLKLKKSNS